MKKEVYKRLIIDILIYAIGCLIYSAAVTMFISSNEIVFEIV